jgi:ferredoxin
VSEATVTIVGPREQKSYRIRVGLGFQALCAREKTPLEFDCREADCGICIMRVVEGLKNLSDKTDAERDFLTAMRADDDERLACQARILGDVRVVVEDA